MINHGYDEGTSQRKILVSKNGHSAQKIGNPQIKFDYTTRRRGQNSILQIVSRNMTSSSRLRTSKTVAW